MKFVLPGATLHYLPSMKPSPCGEYEIQTIINQKLQDGFTACSLAQEIPREWNAAMMQ